MSRIGFKEIKLPNNVKVAESDFVVKVEGPKGKLLQKLMPNLELNIENDIVKINRTSEDKKTKAFHGLIRSLVNNMVVGVSEGYKKVLVIVGTGYRSQLKGKILNLQLGYSHHINYKIPEGITITCESPTRILIEGIDKEKVGQVAAEIRRFRPPEPYKGKGIKYENEIIRKKVGKAAK